MRKLIFNKFIIISDEEKSANEFAFNKNLNVFVGGNKSGKSSLAKSILYTLGCDVVFEDEWSKLEKTFLLFFEFDGTKFCIKRVNLTGKYNAQKGSNVFELINISNNNIHRFNKTTELASYWNNLFNFKIKLLTREKLEQSQIFPNHMFLLNYLDQDTSWGNLLTDTFNNQSFLIDYKNSIVDYFLGYRTNEYYNLSNGLKSLQNMKKTESDDLKSLINLYDTNNKKIQVVENIDVETYRDSLEMLNNQVQSIIKKESKHKIDLSNLLYERNKLKVVNDEMAITLERNNNDASVNCPVCGNHKTIENEELYLITSNMYEMRKERDMNLVRIADLQSKILKVKSKINELIQEQKSLTKSLTIGKEKLNLVESIKNYGVIELSKDLKNQIEDKRKVIEGLNTEIKSIRKQINGLFENKELVSKYNASLSKIFNKLRIKLKYKNNKNQFLRFSTSYSGTERVSAIIGFYMNINKFTSLNEDTPTFPFVLDTLYKEDYDNANEINLLDVYLNEMSGVSQQKILFTSNRERITQCLEDKNVAYSMIKGHKKMLSDENYLVIKEKYKHFNV